MATTPAGTLMEDWAINQGATCSRGYRPTVAGAPIDGTWSARSQVRKAIRDTVPLLTLAPTIVDGVVQLALTPVETTALA